MTVVHLAALTASSHAPAGCVSAGLRGAEVVCSPSWTGEPADDDEEDGDERERDPDVTWQKETVSRSVVEEPTRDELEVPFGER
jgi:hypothetical protein